MTHEPRCPECRTPVQPTWDWCMACGYDPERLKPADWRPGLVGASVGATVGGARSPVSPVSQARPQAMADLDWITVDPPKRLSYLGVAGLVAAIVIAVGTLILVTVLVLNRPIGTTQANALAAPAAVSGPVAAAAG